MKSDIRHWLQLVIEAERRKQEILVVVHPGSACGSADFNLGNQLAGQCRRMLISDIAVWNGGIIILDGKLSSELNQPKYRNLGQVLRDSLSRAKTAKQIAIRRMADDPEQMRIMRQIVVEKNFSPENTRFQLTGAWIHSSDGGGCVNSVADVLRQAGFAVQVRPSALDLDMVDQNLTEATRRYLTIYRGEYSGNKSGFFWTEDREFARQFTQSGRDHEILVRYIFPGDIYKKSADVYAGNETGVDASIAAAKAEDYKAVLLSEGPGQPKSIYVFDRSALMRSPPI